MVPITSTTAHGAHVSGRALPHGTGAAPDFALALTALLLPGEPGDAALPEGEERQAIAATGKDLPQGTADSDEKDGEDDGEHADAPFAWFAIPLAPVTATPLGVGLPRPVDPSRVPQTGEQPAGLQFPGEALARAGFGTPAPVEAQAGPAITVSAEGQPAAVPAASAAAFAAISAAIEATQAKPGAQPPKAEAPIRIELPAVEARPQPLAVPLAQPVAQQPESARPLVAPLALNTELPAQPRRAAAREGEPLAAAIAPASGDVVRPHQVAPTHEAQQPALDMRRHEWMASMIDRIEALRDSPGSRETSIRLTPDALGTVDVSIRHEGDRVHVRIAADTQAARTLLNEAQPRLAELAEARGIKLGATSVGVDAGVAGQGQQPRQEAPRMAAAPAPVAATAEAEAETDQRIA